MFSYGVDATDQSDANPEIRNGMSTLNKIITGAKSM